MHRHISLLSLFGILGVATTATSTSVIGCYSSAGSMQSQGQNTFQSIESCTQTCISAGKTYGAVTDGTKCLCGDELPPASDKVADNLCNMACPGYATTNCGGTNSFTIFSAQSSGNSPSNLSSLPSVPTSHTSYIQTTLTGGIVVEGGDSGTFTSTPTLSFTNPGGLMSTAIASPSASSSPAAVSTGSGSGSTSSLASSTSSSSSSSSSPSSSSSNSADRMVALSATTRGSIFMGATLALLFINL